MKKSIKVRVTQKNIDEGCMENFHFCPIARAVRAAGFERITVDGCELSIGQYGHGQKVYRLSKKARNFVNNFDQGVPVRPFTFHAKEASW